MKGVVRQCLALSAHLKVIIIVTINVTLINFNFLPYCLSHRLYLFALPYILFTRLQISCMCPWLRKVFSSPGNACELHSGLSFHLYFQIMDFFSEICCRYCHTAFQHPTPHLFSHCIFNTMLCHMLLLLAFLSRRK